MKNLTALCILGLAVLIVANNETFARPQEQGDKKCSDNKDNDGDGLIDAADPGCQDIAYTAGLTTGVFQFAAVGVTPNSTENALIPDIDGFLTFNRPGGDAVCSTICDEDGDCTPLEKDTEAACNEWDAVIESCDHLVDTGLIGANVPRFTVSADNLGFEAPGGGLVHLHGIEVFDPDTDELFMGLNFLLIGDCFDDCIAGFLPASGTKTIQMLAVRVTGHTVARGPKGHCNKDGHILIFDLPNDLVITTN